MKIFKLLICASLLGCNGGGGGGFGDGGLDPSLIEGLIPIEEITQLRGRVSDLDGMPLEGVTVSSGALSATTPPSGRYALNLTPGTQVLRFSLEGHVTQIKRVTIIADQPTMLDASLRAEAPPKPLDVTAGGRVDGARGAAINAPAAAFAKPDGTLATGDVQVRITPIDPSVTAELFSVSGDFRGETTDGALTLLESFGMIDVTVRQGDTPLQVAEGQTVEIRVPAPANVETPPETMPLWGFDEAESRWVEEGVATYDPTEKVYVGEVSHFSPHNVDRPAPAPVCVSGRILDLSGRPVGGARVLVETVGANTSSEVTSDASGRFFTSTIEDVPLVIKAYHRESGAHTREIGTSGTFINANLDPGPEDECGDLGEWTVERDVFRGPDGTQVICGDMNPLIGTCAEALLEQMGGCFRPAGGCTIHMNGDIEWDNGVSLEASLTTSSFEAIYFGREGGVCGWIEVEASIEEGFKDYRFGLPGGDNYGINLTGSALSQMIIGCPSGESVAASEAQREAIEACSARVEESGCGLDDIEWGFEGMDEGEVCTPGDCKAGLQCCMTTSVGVADAGLCIKDDAPCLSL